MKVIYLYTKASIIPEAGSAQMSANFLEKTFKKHPAIAPIVKRTPEFFTSNHAPFFTFQNN